LRWKVLRNEIESLTLLSIAPRQLTLCSVLLKFEIVLGQVSLNGDFKMPQAATAELGIVRSPSSRIAPKGYYKTENIALPTSIWSVA
jgi:hypothetical protein